VPVTRWNLPEESLDEVGTYTADSARDILIRRGIKPSFRRSQASHFSDTSGGQVMKIVQVRSPCGICSWRPEVKTRSWVRQLRALFHLGPSHIRAEQDGLSSGQIDRTTKADSSLPSDRQLRTC
jgi:hypothetical protein